MQKNRCPFFFFDGGAPPASVSWSDPSRSPSESTFIASSDMVEAVLECPARAEPSPRLDFATTSGSWSVGEDRSEEAATPLGIARGVVAPSMVWSSVAAEVLTGRKEAMRGAT